MPVAGVEVFQRHLALPALAGQHDAGVQRNQQRHRVANRRAVGHVAAQRARVAHRQAGKARGKGAEFRPVLHQRGKSVMQIGGGTDHQVAVVRFNAAQLGHAGEVDHSVINFVQLGHPQADVGAAGHQLRSGPGGAGGQQFSQGGGQKVGALSLARGRLDLRQRGLEPVLVKPHRRKAGHLLRRVQDGPVTGAAAQVARQLGLRQFA